MKYVRQAVVSIVIFILVPMAQADSLCTFTTECYEDESCQDTAFEVTFRAGTGGPNEMELVTDAETIGVAVGGNAQIAHFAGMTENGFYILTLASADGAARFTAHLGEGPQSITYLGACELGG